VITALGMFWKREIPVGLRARAGSVCQRVGRTAAWAGLMMVLIQVMIVFLQRIFRVAEIQAWAAGHGLQPST
jgi:hypothetical protein